MLIQQMVHEVVQMPKCINEKCYTFVAINRIVFEPNPVAIEPEN